MALADLSDDQRLILSTLIEMVDLDTLRENLALEGYVVTNAELSDELHDLPIDLGLMR